MDTKVLHLANRWWSNSMRVTEEVGSVIQNGHIKIKKQIKSESSY